MGERGRRIGGCTWGTESPLGASFGVPGWEGNNVPGNTCYRLGRDPTAQHTERLITPPFSFRVRTPAGPKSHLAREDSLGIVDSDRLANYEGYVRTRSAVSHPHPSVSGPIALSLAPARTRMFRRDGGWEVLRRRKNSVRHPNAPTPTKQQGKPTTRTRCGLPPFLCYSRDHLIENKRTPSVKSLPKAYIWGGETHTSSSHCTAAVRRRS